MRSLKDLAAIVILAAVSSAAAPATAPATTTAPAKVDPAKLDAKGYIRQWLVLAPINFAPETYNPEDIDKDQITDEAKLTPKDGDKQKVKSEETVGDATQSVEKELTWKKFVPEDFDCDFNAFLKLPESEHVGGYAVAYLDVPEEIKNVTFSLSTNDSGKIFLNGKPIFKFVGGRALEEDSDTVKDLTLLKGTNVIIFKVWNDANNWQGCLRLLDKDGTPLTNVTVKLAK